MSFLLNTNPSSRAFEQKPTTPLDNPGSFRQPPPELQKKLFLISQNMSHPNWNKANKLISACFTCPRLANNLMDWYKECLLCQNSKVKLHTRTSPATTEGYPSRFQHLHMDIVGLLPAVLNCPSRYILPFTDRSTDWIGSTPISSVTAEVVAETSFLLGFRGSESHSTLLPITNASSNLIGSLNYQNCLVLHVFVLHLITPKAMAKTKGTIEL